MRASRRALPQYKPWAPDQANGVVAYWNADDLAGGSGAAVSSWTDRVSGIALAQATGTAQPTIVTNSGGTGHQAARFTKANSQIMTAARGSLPAQGPLWVWVVQKLVTATGQTDVFEVSTPSTTNVGWSAEQVAVIAWGVSSYSPGGGDPLGTLVWRTWTFDPVTAHTVTSVRNNLNNAPAVAAASNANAGATTAALGGSASHSSFYLDSEVMLVLVGTGTPTSSTMQKMGKWLYQNYGVFCGTGTQAPAKVTIPGATHTGAATTDAVELGVVYNPSGIFTHNYWCAFTPFVGGKPDENPCIAYSDDGNTWSTPAGVTNPLVAYPGGGTAGNLADPSLLDNTSRDGKLYLYYVLEGASVGPANGVYGLSSTDGSTWTTLGAVMTTGSTFSECPVVTYDPATSKYWLYTMDIGSTPTTIYRQTSSSPTGPWSAQVACTLTIPGGLSAWHQGTPVLINGKWVHCFSDTAAGGRNLWLASSTDGLTWSCAPAPLVVPGLTSWDTPSLYRPAIQAAGDGANLLLWYVGGTGGVGANTFLSQKVTVPYTLIP